jgi:AcrR family transcriptional regulator
MNRKRGPYSSERQKERRLRILHHASSHLEQYGLEALTMQSIAEISEVSPRTLYNLFGSRDSLLLEAAYQQLSELQEIPAIRDAEPGIPRLLAFISNSMLRFEEMPEYGRAVISILLRADLDSEAAELRFGPVQDFAYKSLCIAEDNGELSPGLNLEELSFQIAANEWGVLLLWEKGLLKSEQLQRQVYLNLYLTLTGLCEGRRRAAMEVELGRFLHSSHSVAGLNRLA